jgi:predicted O-linked N-acetylglucosamine transferase (SPINDLY family)
VIRIGYHCAFMNSDTIRFIMSAVVERHDRSQFTVYGYSHTDVAPDIAAAFDTVVVTSDLSDEQFAARVRADRIDILVELSGFSPHHRFAAMARRCAPVQVNYLNHSATSGVANVDIVLVDEVSVPLGHEAFFTERVWRVPGCFLCYNYDMLPITPVAPVPSRTAGHVTFGCFGSGGKINEELVAIWSRILDRVPDSRLYLRNSELTPPDNRRFMRSRFARHGIAPERIRLDGGAPRAEFIRSYADVDVSLDTWPYCGGNTVAESLHEGVPVVTLEGDRFSSRYGASLLLASGCAELVARDADEYVHIAVELARTPRRLEHYRTNLRRMMHDFGLSDADRFVRKLEDAYQAMVGQLCPA